MATVVVARAADTLTAVRVPLAVLLAVVLAAERLVSGVVILICAWITDTLDGTLARRAPGLTRLGPWDAYADGAVSVGLMLGLVGGGYTPVGWLLPVLVLGGLLYSVRSLASGMLLQGMAYGWFIRVVVTEDRAAWNVLLGAIVAAAIVYGHRVPRVLIPRFFADLARLRRSPR